MISELKRKKPSIDQEEVKKEMKKRKIFISPNEPEITSYAILVSQDYKKYIYENICAGFDSVEANPLFNSK